MIKTFSLPVTIAVAVLGLAALAAPAQAATRLMSSSLEGFEHRCEKFGGLFAQDGTVVSCETPSVPVSCQYFTARQADCNWPGIENQIDVIRVIGTLAIGVDGQSSSSNGGSAGNGNNGGGGNGGGGNGGGGNGGGFQGPKDIKDAPNNDPKPNFDGPKDFQMAP